MKKPKTVTKTLVLVVTYKLKGVSGDRLDDLLGFVARHAASDAMLTGDTQAEVETWDHKVWTGDVGKMMGSYDKLRDAAAQVVAEAAGRGDISDKAVRMLAGALNDPEQAADLLKRLTARKKGK